MDPSESKRSPQGGAANKTGEAAAIQKVLEDKQAEIKEL
jgi:hypothetical protein